MCRPDSTPPPATPTTAAAQPLRLLLSLKSYEGPTSGQGPDAASSILTGLVFILFLVAAEQLCQAWFVQNQDLHPLLQDDLNRRILARHIGVDTLSCSICAFLGFLRIRQYEGIWNLYTSVKKKETSSTKESSSGAVFVKAAYLNRTLSYDPSSYRICLFFLCYQIKNLYDTILFNDGPEFIFHHVFSGLTAYGCMGPKIANFYPFFFIGLSEVSTAVLCLLANFDDVHGVRGLAEALPTLKIILAVLFVVTFIICRVITWPLLSYHFFEDMLNTLKHHGDDPRVAKREGWFYFFLVSNGSLTLLQIAWLFQIFYMAYKEMAAMGIL